MSLSLNSWVTLRFLLLGLVLTACGGATLTVVINSPPSNSQFDEGDQVVVEATATGQGVERIELWVDGNLEDAVLSPTPQNTFTAQLEWQAAGIGPHTIQVIAYNEGGQDSEPAAITVQVGISVAETTATTAAEETSTPVSVEATSTPVSSPVPTKTPTPTTVPTATPGATISFTADDTALTLGECTDLHWDVHNIKEVYLITNGGSPEGVAGEMQTRNVCPADDTTYTLRVKKLDDSIVNTPITIMVTPWHVVVELRKITVNNDTDSDAMFCVFDCGPGEIWFEFKGSGNNRYPGAGTTEMGSGESEGFADGEFVVFDLEMGVGDNLKVRVLGFDDDAFGTDSLGETVFNFSAPPGFGWCGEYTQTSDSGDFEVTIDVTSPCFILIPPIILP